MFHLEIKTLAAEKHLIRKLVRQNTEEQKSTYMGWKVSVNVFTKPFIVRKAFQTKKLSERQTVSTRKES